MVCPPFQRCLLRNVTVSVLLPELLELIKPGLPQSLVLSKLRFPRESHAVEPCLLFLGQLISIFGVSLCVYPCSQFGCLLRHVAVSMLLLILLELIKFDSPKASAIG